MSKHLKAAIEQNDPNLVRKALRTVKDPNRRLAGSTTAPLPDWAPFSTDLVIGGDGVVDRARLEAGLQVYFRQQGLDTDWDAIRQSEDRVWRRAQADSRPARP